MEPNRLCSVLCATWAWCAACVPEFDDTLSRVTEDQILAVRAVPAEAAEGERVQLDALHAGRGDVAFHLCSERKSLTELGPIDPACLGDGDALEPIPGGTFTLPMGACSTFGPRRPDPEPGKPAARAVDPDPTGGYYQPVLAALGGELAVGAVRLDCGIAGADREQAVEYTARYRPNANVEVERLQARVGSAWREVADDTPLQVRRGAELTLRVTWAACASEAECEGDAGTCQDDVGGACTCAEHYVSYDPGARRIVERTERVVATWFTTQGDLLDHRTSADGRSSVNRWLAPEEGGNVRLWVVLRDGRGGIGWRSFRAQVQ